MAATAAALALIVTSTGDVFLMAAVLGLAAADVAVVASASLVAVSVLARWGTTSLAGLAGVQAVVGPAGFRGAIAAVVSAWCGGAALVAAAGGARRATTVSLGLAAGLVVAGPSAATMGSALVRAAGALVGVGLAGLCARVVPRRVAVAVSLALAAAAVVLGVAA